jgi:filamentous hemagglutinin family protein
VGGILAALPAIAQLVPDGSLGAEQSVVTPGSVGGLPANLIQGGARRNALLFHSFRDFNVGEASRVYFGNPPGVTTIFTRVTGATPSNILGTLGVSGGANLFLLNPNGILFGPNARLDLRGSFVTSTANSILLDNGVAFSATNPGAPPLLTVNVPIGLQYGANPGSIAVQGSLQVRPGQTLALVGGEVRLEGGRLTAAGGQIELGSVAAGSLVAIAPTNPGWAFNYQDVQQFQDIRLTQAARVDASGSGGGSIQVQGRQLSLTEGSRIVTTTLGNQAGRNLIIRTTESVEVVGGSRLAAQTDSTGNGGKLTIQTGTLRVADGARVLTYTDGAGNSGDLTVQAQLVEVVGGSRLAAQTDSTGNGGNLTIETGTLRAADDARVSTNTDGAGNGGDLMVRAQSVEVMGASRLTAETEVGKTGNGGNLTIETGTLRAADDARISTNTAGASNGGDLTVRAQSVEVMGASRLAAQANIGSVGNAGNLTIETRTLRVADGARASTSTFGPGNSGNLTVRAQSVEVIGFNPRDYSEYSFLSADTRLGSTGNAGNLTLETRTLRVAGGAVISTKTNGAGDGGDLTVQAQSVEVIGFNPQDGSPSVLITEASRDSTGNAGNLILTIDRLHIANQGEIRATSGGTGSAGNIEVQAASGIILADNARITSNTNAGQGNITLTTPLLLLRRASSITTNATGEATGGNIRINGGFIVAVPDENSDITANAIAGNGGRVNITAQGIFGIAFRPRLTSLSDITASSEFGPSGIVTLNTPNIDPNRGTIELPSGLVDTNALIANSCIARGAKQGSFMVTGAGGLPEMPDHLASSAFETYTIPTPTQVQSIPQSQPDQTIQEVDGIYQLPTGEIVLGRSCR